MMIRLMTAFLHIVATQEFDCFIADPAQRRKRRSRLSQFIVVLLDAPRKVGRLTMRLRLGIQLCTTLTHFIPSLETSEAFHWFHFRMRRQTHSEDDETLSRYEKRQLQTLFL